MLNDSRFENTVFNFNFIHLSVVLNLNAQFLSTAIVGIDQGFAATHEKGIGARRVKRT